VTRAASRHRAGPSLETYLERKWIPLAGRPGPTLCVVTRVRVRRPHHLVVLAAAYRRMRKLAAGVPGLLSTATFVRPPRTIFFVSLWRDHDAMADFASAVHDHARTVGWARRRGAEAWSGLFELRGASKSSDDWA
jgi:heme-degrading monooxygenase HmoA